MTVRIDEYHKPVLTKLDNLKEMTFECSDWQCSVTVPLVPSK